MLYEPTESPLDLSGPPPEGTEAPCACDIDPADPLHIQASSKLSDAELAQQLYGDPALAPFIVRQEGRVRILPDLLRPSLRLRFLGVLRQELKRDLEALGAMQLEGELDPQVLRAIVGWWAQFKDASGGANITLFDAFLKQAAGALGHQQGVLQAFERDGATMAIVSAASRDFGGPKAIEALASHILDRLEGYTSDAESQNVTDLMVTLPVPLQALVLMRIMSRFDERNALGTPRFWDTRPDKMLDFLFENLSEPDHARLAESLVQGGVLPPKVARALQQGRGIAEIFPGTTEYAEHAAQFWADASVKHEGTWAGDDATFLGGLASLWLPNTAGQTLTTLGSAGLGKALFGRFALLDRAMMVGGVGLGGYHTTLSAQEWWTGKDAFTGRALGAGELIAKLLHAGAGTIMLASGLAISLKAGRLTARRMSPREVADLKRNTITIPHKDLPKGAWLLIEKGSPAHRAWLADQASPKRLPGSRGQARIASPVIRGHLDGASVSKAASLARARIGNVRAQLTKGLQFDPTDKASVLARATAEGARAAQTAYLSAKRVGKADKYAGKEADKAAKVAMQPSLERGAAEAAKKRAQAALKDGTAFDPNKLDSASMSQLQAYRDGKTGTEARRLAPKLAKMNEEEFLSFMEQERKAGRAVYKEVQLGNPAQRMKVWDYGKDGTVVRYKPKGDKRRKGPTYSVDMKKEPSKLDSGPKDAAFKVSPTGEPVPKSVMTATNPYSESTAKFQCLKFEDALMDEGHRSLRSE